MAARDSERGLPRKVLLVGPLPPPFGGARVSFKLFLDELTTLGRPTVSVVNVPIRKTSSECVQGPVHHPKTFWVVLKSLSKLRQVEAVWVFCSPRFGLSYGLVYLLACRLMRVSAALRFFGGHPYQTAKKIWKPLRHCVDTVLGYAQQIVVQTEVGRGEFPSILQRRLQVVHGYRRVSADPVGSSSINDDGEKIKFYYAGSISRDKGAFLLVDAFKLADQILSTSETLIELHLFGADAEGFSQFVQGSDRVYYHGVIENNSLLRRLNEFDVLVFPSMYHNEGHSGAIIEAMMAGKPVICFDLPGPSELVTNDVNGIIVECCSTGAFASAIARLSQDAEFRRRLSARALQDSKRYDAKIAIPKLIDALSGSINQ